MKPLNESTRVSEVPLNAEVENAALRRPWRAPTLDPLPPLTELTLQSFVPGEGWIGEGGGSTVF